MFSAKEEVDRQQREKVVLAFAKNALPYRLIDDEEFRAAFGMQIPRKLDRHELASATEIMRRNTEMHLVHRYISFCKMGRVYTFSA